MKPPVFEYHAPRQREEALTLLAEHAWDAKALAGGQSLVPAMNFRLASPAVLVDLNGIDDLQGIEETESGLLIHAMTRQSAVERSSLVARVAPLLHEAMPHIAHPQIRSRGTIGGSVAHADPAAELPAIMLALEANLHLAGAEGAREVPASEFFYGLLMTALAPEELLVGIEVPTLPDRTGTAFVEFARRHGDYALVGVASVITLDEVGACASARIALLSVGEAPFLAEQAGAVLAGEVVDEAAIAAAADAAAAEIDPPNDLHASAAYRRHLTRVLVGRALRTAVARASGESR